MSRCRFVVVGNKKQGKIKMKVEKMNVIQIVCVERGCEYESMKVLESNEADFNNADLVICNGLVLKNSLGNIHKEH